MRFSEHKGPREAPPTNVLNGVDGGETQLEKLKHAWKILPDAWALISPEKEYCSSALLMVLIEWRASSPGFDEVPDRQCHQQAPDSIAELRLSLRSLVLRLFKDSHHFADSIVVESSHRMISELRVKVQAHIGRLPVAFYDATKSGVLVSRIMTDVEGVRNLLVHGLIDFAGNDDVR